MKEGLAHVVKIAGCKLEEHPKLCLLDSLEDELFIVRSKEP